MSTPPLSTNKQLVVDAMEFVKTQVYAQLALLADPDKAKKLVRSLS